MKSSLLTFMMDGQPPPPGLETEADLLITQLLNQRKMVSELQKDVIRLVNRIKLREERSNDGDGANVEVEQLTSEIEEIKL